MFNSSTVMLSFSVYKRGRERERLNEVKGCGSEEIYSKENKEGPENCKNEAKRAINARGWMM
jgi:hypothetical protein